VKSDVLQNELLIQFKGVDVQTGTETTAQGYFPALRPGSKLNKLFNS